MVISPADMVLFAAVVREGSFTRAARQLGVTKQTVSERVAKLEAQLGVRLLERTTRRLRVTDAGSGYYERCSAIATQIDEANDEVQRRQAEPVGMVRLSAPVLYGRRFLAAVVADYLTRHPAMRVEVVLADRRVDLIEEAIDLAIRIGALDDSSLTVRKLGEAHLHYVASPTLLPAKGQGELDPRSLRCVGTRPFETWRLHGRSFRVEPSLVVNDLEVVCAAAIAGVGVARLPALVCREAVADGRLRVVFGPAPAVVVPVFAVYPSRRHLAPKVRMLIEAIAEEVEPMLTLASPAGTKKPRRTGPAR